MGLVTTDIFFNLNSLRHVKGMGMRYVECTSGTGPGIQQVEITSIQGTGEPRRQWPEISGSSKKCGFVSEKPSLKLEC